MNYLLRHHHRFRCRGRYWQLDFRYGVDLVFDGGGKYRGCNPFLGCSLLRFRRRFYCRRLHFRADLVAALGEFCARRVFRLFCAFQRNGLPALCAGSTFAALAP
ncbi:MAG: hypothetical protein MUP61_07245, partial [Burkholderiales bacterium]|nr:hypothetical protein [Burkholderiales bacterium]